MEDEQRKSRKRRHVEAAREYLAANVDDMMNEMITSLLLEQPADVNGAALQFLQKRNAAAGSSASPTETSPPRKIAKPDKAYMKTQITPLLTELIGKLVRAAPDDVETFLIDLLSASETRPAEEASVDVSRSQSRLDAARALDTAVEVSPSAVEAVSEAASSAPVAAASPAPALPTHRRCTITSGALAPTRAPSARRR